MLRKGLGSDGVQLLCASRMCVCCTQDLLQEELHEDDLESVKRSAQGLGVEVCGWKPVPPSSMYQSANGTLVR